jgi:hypothetical protein
VEPPLPRDLFLLVRLEAIFRQPTWDLACKLQADMFRAAAAVGGLDIQLVYFIAAWWNAAPRPGLLIRIDWAH